MSTLATIRFRLLKGDEKTKFVDGASNTHTLADFSIVDGILQAVVAIDCATCNVVRNVEPGNSR